MTKVDGQLLWTCILEPKTLLTLAGTSLTDLLSLAWQQGVIFRLAKEAQDGAVIDELPAHIASALTDLAAEARYNARRMAWEINRVAAAVRGEGYPVLVLKGAAYQAAGYGFAAGRVSSDVDVLVPKRNLAQCEAALEAAGWQFEAKTDYDDQYYRDWMHELPPLRHKARLTVMDLHHNILPPVARILPDIEAFIADAVEVEDAPLKRPSLVDMVVHSALHCFYDGDFTTNLRSILDLHDLFKAGLNADETFIALVVARAKLHGAGRPVADALDLLSRCGALALDEDARNFVMAKQRLRPVEAVYQWAVACRTFAVRPYKKDHLAARFLLYGRSHWITMPPVMLFKHLSRKLIMRMKGHA